MFCDIDVDVQTSESENFLETKEINYKDSPSMTIDKPTLKEEIPQLKNDEETHLSMP